MQPDPDELAGVTDLFGGLTREELRSAFSDLVARAGADFDGDEIDAAVEDALDRYYLVAVEPEDGSDEADPVSGDDGGVDGGAHPELLASGPAALPRLPEGGEDLPHLVDVDHRSVDRAALGEGALARLRGDAARAVNDGDEERIAALLDVCYDLEAWAPVETDELRARLDDAL